MADKRKRAACQLEKAWTAGGEADDERQHARESAPEARGPRERQDRSLAVSPIWDRKTGWAWISREHAVRPVAARAVGPKLILGYRGARLGRPMAELEQRLNETAFEILGDGKGPPTGLPTARAGGNRARGGVPRALWHPSRVSRW